VAYCGKPMPPGALPSAAAAAWGFGGFGGGGNPAAAFGGFSSIYSNGAALAAAARPASGGNPSHLQIILARVALGRQCAGRAGMQRPPQGFESVTGGLAGPDTAHVVFDNAQAYPEYVVTLTR
jgi:hypothetical protein